MNAAIIIGVVASSIMSGTSLLYATLGEIVGERSGVVNLGLEGIMLIGASTGFAATAATGNPYLGVAAAAISGAAVNMIFAYLVVGRGANQLATGLTLMFFCFGLSAMIGRPFVGTLITGLPRLPLFGLGSGAAAARLLSYDLLVYLAAPVALTVWWLLYRTRWGSLCAPPARARPWHLRQACARSGCAIRPWSWPACSAGLQARIFRWR